LKKNWNGIQLTKSRNLTLISPAPPFQIELWVVCNKEAKNRDKKKIGINVHRTGYQSSKETKGVLDRRGTTVTQRTDRRRQKEVNKGHNHNIF